MVTEHVYVCFQVDLEQSKIANSAEKVASNGGGGDVLAGAAGLWGNAEAELLSRNTFHAFLLLETYERNAAFLQSAHGRSEPRVKTIVFGWLHACVRSE